MQVGKGLCSVPNLLLVLSSPPAPGDPGVAGASRTHQSQFQHNQFATGPSFPPLLAKPCMGTAQGPQRKALPALPHKTTGSGWPTATQPPRAPQFSCISPPPDQLPEQAGAAVRTGCGAGIRHLPLTLFLTALIWWGMRSGSQIPPLGNPPPATRTRSHLQGTPRTRARDVKVWAGFGAVPPTSHTDGEMGGQTHRHPPCHAPKRSPKSPLPDPPHSPQGLAAPCGAPRRAQGPPKSTGTPFPQDVPPLLAAPKPPERDGAGTPDPQSLTCQLGAFPSPIHGSSSAGAPRSPPEPPGPVAACSRLPGARPLAAGK